MSSKKGRIQAIYKIENLKTGTVYIGSSKHTTKRLHQHKTHLINDKHANKKLQKDWNKYGENSFEFKIIELVENVEELVIKEKDYIEKYKEVNNVYNISDPLNEFDVLKNRKSNVEKERKKRGSGKIEKDCIEYMQNEFKNDLEKLSKGIEKSLMYEKDKIDAHFIKLIPKDMFEAEVVQDALYKVYNKLNIDIIDGMRYYRELKSKGFKCYNGKILILRDFSKELYNKKYRPEFFDELLKCDRIKYYK